jgi:hypothetical protein
MISPVLKLDIRGREDAGKSTGANRHPAGQAYDRTPDGERLADWVIRRALELTFTSHNMAPLARHSVPARHTTSGPTRELDNVEAKDRES